ncbi:MAG: hypothetical protein HZA49_05620 [Planctomycetes bacterium]|nr:hypothetical protein [Planctomycetota bacterium]
MNETVNKKPSWWSGNWKWFVPVMALAAAIIAGLAIFGFVYSIFAVMKSSDAYKMSLSYARENEAAVKLFGGKIEPGWYLSGNIHVSGSSGNAELAIPVQCGAKSGWLYVEAVKSAGQWTILKLALEESGAGQRLVLIDRKK